MYNCTNNNSFSQIDSSEDSKHLHSHLLALQMHAFLHVEELQHEVEIRSYDMEAAVLTLAGSSRNLLLKVGIHHHGRYPSLHCSHSLYVPTIACCFGTVDLQAGCLQSNITFFMLCCARMPDLHRFQMCITSCSHLEPCAVSDM